MASVAGSPGSRRFDAPPFVMGVRISGWLLSSERREKNNVGSCQLSLVVARSGLSETRCWVGEGSAGLPLDQLSDDLSDLFQDDVRQVTEKKVLPKEATTWESLAGIVAATARPGTIWFMIECFCCLIDTSTHATTLHPERVRRGMRRYNSKLSCGRY